MRHKKVLHDENVSSDSKGIYKIDFPNDDGTVDEWVYDTNYYPWRTKQVTVNIRRTKAVTGKK